MPQAIPAINKQPAAELVNFASYNRNFRLLVHLRLPAFFSLLLLCLLLTVPAYAQEDTLFAVPSGRTHTIDARGLLRNTNTWVPIDTNITPHLHNVDTGYLHNLGFYASPAFPIIWQPFTDPGFRLGFHQWDQHSFRQETVKFYRTQNPYTKFHYAQGAQAMQLFRAIHSQNVLPHANVTLQYFRLRTNEGEYDRQRSLISNFAFNGWFRSLNQRYLAIASVVLNNYNAQENGGLANDNAFRNAEAGNRTRLPVAINGTASQDYTEQDYLLQQFLFTGPAEHRFRNDSDSVGFKIVQPRFYFGHRFSFSQNRYHYQDVVAPGSFYENNFFNQPYSSDRSSSRRFSNEAAFGRNARTILPKDRKKGDTTEVDQERKLGFGFEANARYEFIDVKENAAYFPEYNFSIGGELNGTGLIGWSGEGRYYVSGYNQGDYLLKTDFTLPFIRSIGIPLLKLYGRLQEYRPAFITERYHSNRFFWDNDFRKTNAIEIGAQAYNSSRPFKLGLALGRAQNYVYYDSTGIVRQGDSAITYVRAEVRKDFSFGIFRLRHELVGQYLFSGSDYARVPALYARLSYYVEGEPRFLTRAPAPGSLIVQLGVDLTYFSPWDGYGYMPGIGQFVIQDQVRLGGYPYFDVWLAAKVKRFQFFVKLEHANQGLTGNNYFTTAHYPLYPRAIRFGLQWMFFN